MLGQVTASPIVRYFAVDTPKTSNNNISSLKNDTKMNDHSINSKFKGAFNDVNFIFHLKINKYTLN